MSARILVVEDSPTQLEALRALLAAEGYEVLTARDGNEALARIREQPPELVLTDVVMPGMSGLELCRRIKDETGADGPAVVLLTGLADPRDIVRGLSSGADNYITKPYEPENVVSRVRGVLGNRALRRSGTRPEGLRIEFMGEEFMLEAEPDRMLEMLLGSFEELARTATRMSKLAREAEAATRARDEVLAAVSHDLRNPVGTIYTSASLLLEMELSPDVRDRQLHIIRRTAERMDRLIQDLLDVSRMEAGRFIVNARPVSVASIIHDAREMLEPLAAAKSIALLERNDADSTLVMADVERVQRVFSNLVGNALKFTPAGRAVTLGARVADDMIEFAVADQGAGIPRDALAHVFDRFWQADKMSREGAGLGLAIARGIVEAHGGAIRAESDPPNGTTFLFTLPLADG